MNTRADDGLRGDGFVSRLSRETLFGRPLEHYDEVDSTQRLAAAAAAKGASEGSLFVAEAQTRGRGRHGHAWQSTAGAGIYASLILRPTQPIAALPLLTLAAGLAVADAVAAVSGLEAELRWPNDLLLDGKKFCGLLVESSADSEHVLYAVLGFGINIHAVAFPPELQPIATWLDAHAPHPISRRELGVAVVHCIEGRYRRFEAGEHAAILEEFERRCRMARNAAVRVGGPDGYTGVTEGLDPTGFLRVRTRDGSLRLVLSGDVRPLN